MITRSRAANLAGWSVGWLVDWFVGSLVRWFVGSLDRWFLGSLVHWFFGLFGWLIAWYVPGGRKRAPRNVGACGSPSGVPRS